MEVALEPAKGLCEGRCGPGGADGASQLPEEWTWYPCRAGAGKGGMERAVGSHFQGC